MERLRGKTVNEREQYLIDLATLDERDRILNIIRDRLTDLESCTKIDGCQDRADGIRLALSDIEWMGTHNG